MIDTSRKRNLLVYLCLTTVVTAVYWPVRHFEFVNYDDPLYVTENQHVQDGLTLRGLAWAFTTNQASNWHPVTWLSHMLDSQLFGLKPGMHHLVSVLFHIANALLLFALLNKITDAPWRSGFVAALFALHPLHVQSVAWVAERKDVLSAFFWMLTIWAYVRYVEQLNVQRSTSNVQHSALSALRSPLSAFYALTLLFFTLGLMSKPMVVTLPFVLLLLDYWPLGRTRWAKAAAGQSVETPPSRLLIEKLPFFALAAASCVITLWAQRGAVNPLEILPVETRMANAVVSYMRYLGKTFWPSGLAVFYPYEKWPSEMVVEAGAVLLGVSAWVIWKARREPHFVMGWLWYLGTLVPVIGLVQVGGQSIADRYSYLPLIGLFIMVAWGVPCGAVQQRARKLVAAVTAVALLGLCAGLCQLQVRYWRNSETLFRHALEVTTGNWIAHNNLGMALWRTGRVPEAIEHYKQALRIDPNYAEAHHNLGLALDRVGKPAEAVAHWQQALRLRPDFAETHNYLGMALWHAGRLPEAIEHYEQALRIQPDYAEAHNNLGNALFQAGRIPEAMEHWEQALRLKPDNAEAHNNLGVALEQAGKLEDAITHYEQAVQSKPDYAKAHYNLGVALEKAGRLQAAIGHYEQALRIQPGMAAAQNRLTRLRAAQ